jgi:ribosomal protein S6
MDDRKVTEEKGGDETRVYELGILLASEEIVPEIGAVLAKRDIRITEESTPVRVKLAYPIKKQESAFFKFFHFNADPSVAEEIGKTFTRHAGVIRHILVTPPSVQDARPPRAPREDAAPKPSVGEPQPALTNEVLEQKLEEILK